MNPADFSRFYDEFTHTAVRIEGGRHYGVPAEDQSLQAFRDGRARPERSVRTSPWLARIALDVTTHSKDWSRIRLVHRPLTEYLRFELVAYVESQAAGERILLAEQSDVHYSGPDVWLFDLDTDHACAVEHHHDGGGAVVDRVLVTDAIALARLSDLRDRAAAASVPLNEFLANEAPRG